MTLPAAEDPRHSDIVRGLVTVPSRMCMQETGLSKAQHYYGEMLEGTTRGTECHLGLRVLQVRCSTCEIPVKYM